MDDELLSLKWNSHKIKFFERLKILRERSDYTDATLAVEGKFYPVHKLVMSNCSEYFRDIFEKTPCKAPVIVLKDVSSNDIEALLDYMYFGEVNVAQNNLASLLQTAECLQIEGLNAPEVEPASLYKTPTSSHDNMQEDRPPPKRRRFDPNTVSPHAASSGPSPRPSTTALVNPAQSPLPSAALSARPHTMMPHTTSVPFPQKSANASVIAAQTPIPLYTTPDNEKSKPSDVNIQVNDSEDSHHKQNERLIVKKELYEEDKQNEKLKKDGIFVETVSSDQDPLGDCMSDIFKLEDEVDDNRPPFHIASSSMQPTPPRMKWKEVPRNNLPPKAVIQDTVVHLPVGLTKRGRCRLDGCKSKPQFYCMKCKVFLCISKKNNCFAKFHGAIVNPMDLPRARERDINSI